MSKNVLEYLCKCSGWLVALTNLHWDAHNMSQHKLCDDISDSLSSFRDKIAEIEQGISGNIELNQLKADEYEITDLEKFIKDVLRDTTSFYKKLDGDENIGLRSVCESFIGDFQQFIYLNRFCIKKDLNEMENKLNNIIKEEINKLIKNKMQLL